MKKYKIILIANLLTLSLFATGVFSQPTNVFKADAIVYVSDTVVFRLTDYVGEHVKWQLSHNLEDWAEIPGATSDSLLFVSDTTTYFRARVIAGFCDPFYSDVMVVRVVPAVVTDIDGNVYQTIIIGDQAWLSKNLRVSKYNNGDPIPTGLSNTEWENTTSGAYAIYPHGSIDGLNSDEDVLEAYGALYNWYAVNTGNLCPEGWRVPSDADWTELVNYVVNQGFPNSNVVNGAGNALKSCRQVGHPDGGDCDTSEHPRWNSHGAHSGLDAFDFSALPGGYRWSSGSFFGVGLFGYCWSATEDSGTHAWNRTMYSDFGYVYWGYYNKRWGFSVRCVLDTAVPEFYNLNLEVNPSGAGYVTGAGEYEEGELVEITAIANPGWEFVNWTGNTEYLDDVNSAEAIVTMPANDINLIANFSEETDYPVYGDGVTDIDGNEYLTVIISNQEWMAENLRVTRYNNEDDIPTGLSDTDWENTTEGAYAIYPHEGGETEDDVEGINSNLEMVEAYGKLYNWNAVDDARGLCPEGWSVPSDADWTTLVDYVVSQGFPNSSVTNGAANALKSCRQVNSPLGGECNTSTHPRWNSDGTHSGFDEFGFSALPGGYRGANGVCSSIGRFGYWWSSSEYSSTNAWGRGMYSFYGSVDRGDVSKSYGFSVRCFRDIGAH